MPFQLLGGNGAMQMPTIQGAPNINPNAGLSQLMQLMGLMSTMQNRSTQQEMNQLRMALMQQQLENGRTDKERERILKDRALKDYANRVVDNPDFIEAVRNADKLSPGRKEKAYNKIYNKFIEPYQYDYNKDLVKSKDVYNYLFYDRIQNAKLQAQEIEDTRWSGLWDSVKASGANLGAAVANMVPGTNTKDLIKWANEKKQEAVNNNLWLKDQELRRRQGEGFTDQSLGDMTRTLLGELPTVLGFGAATAAGAAAGGPGGAAAAAGALGAGLSDFDFATAVEGSGLSDAEKAAAMQSPARYGNTALGGVLGAVAPSVARPFNSAARFFKPSIKPIGLAPNWYTGAARQGLDTAAGMALMSGGQQMASNIALNSALNQNTPWTQGVFDAAVQGAMLGFPMGAGFGMRGPFAAPKKPPMPEQNATGPNGNPSDGLKGPNNNKPTGPDGNEPSIKEHRDAQSPVSEVPASSENQAVKRPLSELLAPLAKHDNPTIRQVHDKIINDNKSIADIIADPDTPAEIKQMLEYKGVPDEKVIKHAAKVIASAEKAKKDATVYNKLINFLGNKDKALSYTDMMNQYASMREALKEPSIKLDVLTRITTQFDKAFTDILKRFPVEEALYKYAKAEAEAARPQATGANVSNDLSNDSGAAAGTGANVKNPVNGAAAQAGSNSQAAAGRVANGTTPPNNRTHQATAGTGQEPGTAAGEGQAGRTGNAATGNGEANASAGEPAAQAGEQPNSPQPEPTFGRAGADGVARLRELFRQNGGTNQEIASLLVPEALKDSPNPAIKKIYDDAAADLLNARGTRMDELTPEDQAKVVATYLDALDQMEAAENAKPSDPVCP